MTLTMQRCSFFLVCCWALLFSQTHAFSLSPPPPNNPMPSQHEITWEDLGRQLLALQQSGIDDLTLINTRLHFPLDRCYVAESKIPNAGRGLFAKHDVSAGTLLTCYPGDVLLQPTGMTNVPPELQQDEPKLRLLLQRYCIGVTDDVAIMGLPNLDDDMAYAGHFANDGAVPPTKEEELEAYMQSSQKVANAQHLPLENLHMVTIAQRDIAKDEEILVFYGPVYWMDHSDTWRGDKY